jgi:hypothetical protein
LTDPTTPPGDAQPRHGLAREVFRFLFNRKRIWLGTLIVLCLLLGILLLLGENPAVAPFVYSVF